MKSSFYGCSWYRGELTGSLHASAWVDAQGVQDCSTYNLSDYTGEHDTGSSHFNGLSPALQAEVLNQLALAVRDARDERDYCLKRINAKLPEKYATAFLVTIGHYGHSVYMDESRSATSTLSGYGLSDAEWKMFDAAGVPIVDNRTINDDLIVAASLRSPMPPARMFDADADAAPWGSLSRATVAGYCYFRQACGAAIVNTPDLSGIDDTMFKESQVETMRQAAVVA